MTEHEHELQDVKLCLARIETTLALMTKMFEESKEDREVVKARIAQIESKINYAAGVIASAMLVATFVFQYILRKLTA